jgi:hypothetical protein
MVGLATSLDETSEDALGIHGSLDFLKGRSITRDGNAGRRVMASNDNLSFVFGKVRLSSFSAKTNSHHSTVGVDSLDSLPTVVSNDDGLSGTRREAAQQRQPG